MSREPNQGIYRVALTVARKIRAVAAEHRTSCERHISELRADLARQMATWRSQSESTLQTILACRDLLDDKGQRQLHASIADTRVSSRDPVVLRANDLANIVASYRAAYLGGEVSPQIVNQIRAAALREAQYLVPIGTNERLSEDDTLVSISDRLGYALTHLEESAAQVAADAVPRDLSTVDDMPSRSSLEAARIEARGILANATHGSPLAPRVMRAALKLLWRAPKSRRQESARSLAEREMEGRLTSAVGDASALRQWVVETDGKIKQRKRSTDDALESLRHRFLIHSPSLNSELLDNPAPEEFKKRVGPGLNAIAQGVAIWWLGIERARAGRRISRHRNDTDQRITSAIDTAKSEADRTSRRIELEMAKLERSITARLRELAMRVGKDLALLLLPALRWVFIEWDQSKVQNPFDRSAAFRHALATRGEAPWLLRDIRREGFQIDAFEHATIGGAVKIISPEGATTFRPDVWLQLLEEGSAGQPSPRVGKHRDTKQLRIFGLAKNKSRLRNNKNN